MGVFTFPKLHKWYQNAKSGSFTGTKFLSKPKSLAWDHLFSLSLNTHMRWDEGGTREG